MAANTVHVAVGVILDNHQRILIALRAKQLHQGGLWEFPGGKVEPEETAPQALARELMEELNIHVVNTSELLKVQHEYADKTVLLDVWWVDQFNGEAIGKEGQPVRWVSADELLDYAFPEANQAIIKAVQTRLCNLAHRLVRYKI